MGILAVGDELMGDPAHLNNKIGSILHNGMSSLGLTSNYQAQMPDIQKQNIIGQINPALQQAQGINSQQQDLAQALQQQANGAGPNPAQIALNQATSRNQAQAAGQIASQKGINPALAQREIAQNAAAQAQTAAGQGAVMQAQQQLGAQGQMGHVLGQMSGATQQQLGTLEGAQSAQNSAINTGSLGMQNINSGVQAANAKATSDVVGGVLKAGGSAAAMASHGGKVTHGKVPVMVSPGEKILPPDGKEYKVAGKAKVEGDSEENDVVPKMLKGGTVVIPRTKADDGEKEKEFIAALKGSHKKAKYGGASGFSAVLAAHKKLGEHLAKLEKKSA